MEIAAQDDNHDGRIQSKKFLMFKDSFEKIRAGQRMKISSVKTAAHFDQLDGKSFELNFLLNKGSFD